MLTRLYSSCRIHMNLIDINETIPVTGPVPTDQELQDVINKVHALGGLVIVNHIPWSNTTGKQAKKKKKKKLPV